MRKITVLLTGGGTGGHIYPLVAVAGRLKEIAEAEGGDWRFVYLGSFGNYREALQESGLEVRGLADSKLRRYFSPANFIEAPKLFLGFVQALWQVRRLRPDVLFSKGGPGALPVVLAAKICGVPIVIHESDAVPGVTSLLTSKMAVKVLVSFPSSSGFFRRPVVVTGNPVREKVLTAAGIPGAAGAVKKRLDLKTSKPVLLFMGGSQGSVRINNFILNNLPKLADRYQILHQTGRLNYKNVSSAAEEIRRKGADLKNYHTAPYFGDDVGAVLSVADLVISRAGAGGIFELAALGKPAILIPLPESAQNHQLANAREYAAAGAAEVMEEKNLTLGLFLQTAEGILSDRQKKDLMAKAARNFAKPDADLLIAREIAELVRKKVGRR
ncbi:MAG: undecaprenyldiphospho-muramoylpentapeptide beta-N-acetylglucosaminyltransferase [Patescibacteria group bacterium]|nr:undecaprenyldiphospho-muramoylpentapeptide beta-N-acetylglucosaminyltransferase [Patescibacteria group bacterium]